MFLLLIIYVIANGMYATMQWNESATQKVKEDLQNKSTIVNAVLLNELDKFKDLLFTITEQKQKLIELLNYDNQRAINIIFQRIAATQDIDLILFFDEEGVVASNQFLTVHDDNSVYQTLLHNMDIDYGLFSVPGNIFANKYPDYYQQHPDINYICFRTVLQLDYDSGDIAGHIMMLKLINTEPDLVTKMAAISGGEVVLYDQNKHIILSSLEDKDKVYELLDHSFSYGSDSYFVDTIDLYDPLDKIIAKLAVAIDSSLFVQQRQQLIMSNVLPFIGSVVVSILLLFFMKIRIFNRVNQLIYALRKVASGDLKWRLKDWHLHRNDEITYMGLNFNSMMDRLEYVYQELENKGDELQYLNKQLLDEINERKNAEIALLEAKQEAENANKSKSIFLANMSHEIRTPMNAILGYAQILKKDRELNQDQKECITTIERSGLHLLELINDILDISKIEAGRMELNNIDFDLTALINDISRMFALRCQEKDLQWQVKGIDHRYTLIVTGDENKLRQVLINLLGNAVKFTDQGYILLQITEQRDNHFLFDIIDTGKGIKRSAQTSIFDAFHQDEEGIKKGGTGLGLAISKKYVELMGGELALESDVDEGTHFFFQIPLIKISEQESLSCQNENTVYHLPQGQHIQALIADDITVNRRILVHLLNDIGIETIEAEDGEKAIVATKSYQPDIIFMDYRMPKMDGVEAVKKIKLDYQDKIKIVMVSASVFDEDTKCFCEAGCDALIKKPFKTEEVYQCMEKLLAITFEQQDVVTVENNQVDDTLTWQQVKRIPATLLQQLQEAAEFCLISELDELLQKMTSLGEQEMHLANHLHELAKAYDMEAILVVLGNLHGTE